MKKNKTFLIIFFTGFIYFLLFFIPNSMGIRDAHMLSLLSQDESIQYPYLMHMLTPGATLLETIKNFVAYQHYFYGYPFYLYSALVILPIRLIFGSQAAGMTQVNLLILRQLVSVLPMIISAGLLTYMQTRFTSAWKSFLLFVFLLTIPAVIANNLWFWHPDAMTLLGVVLTLFFLDRDDLAFGRNFYFAAIACGFTTATKVIGFFFFLAMLIYLALALIKKKVDQKKILLSALFFVLIMLAVFIILNPLLLVPQTRTQILKIQSQQNYYVTHGWQDEDIYATGLNSWLPYLQQWYALPLFILFLLFSLGYACWRGKQQTTNWLILGWFIPYSLYLIFFVAIKPTHYWLPTMLPLTSAAVIFLTDELSSQADKKRLKTNYLAVTITILVIGLLASQMGRNLTADVRLVNRFMEKERLLLVCNSNPDNSVKDQAAFLQDNRWYRLEEFDHRSFPYVRRYLMIKGPATVSYTNDHGQVAWACVSEQTALFSAERSAYYYKVDHPSIRVFGPRGEEINP